MKFSLRLTFFILISIIVSTFYNVVANNWTALLANFVAFVGWFTVLTYEKKEHGNEDISR